MSNIISTELTKFHITSSESNPALYLLLGISLHCLSPMDRPTPDNITEVKVTGLRTHVNQPQMSLSYFQTAIKPFPYHWALGVWQ